MTVSLTRRYFLRLAVLALGTHLLFCVTGCSAKARARRGLRRVVYREIKQFNKYHRREVKPAVYISRGRFYRTYKDRVDHVVNMRRTNSLDTPFIATLSFTENTYNTRLRAAREESAGDSHFILSRSKKREIIYAFTGGSWKRKEIY